MLTKEQIKNKIRAGEKIIAGPDVAVTMVKVAYQELYEEEVRRRDALTNTLEGIAHFSEDARARGEATATLMQVGAWSSGISDELEFFRHTPHRGSDVEAFIKQARDGWDKGDELQGVIWRALDRLLDDYRLHAATGTPLSEPTPVEGNYRPWEGS